MFQSKKFLKFMIYNWWYFGSNKNMIGTIHPWFPIYLTQFFDFTIFANNLFLNIVREWTWKCFEKTNFNSLICCCFYIEVFWGGKLFGFNSYLLTFSLAGVFWRKKIVEKGGLSILSSNEKKLSYLAKQYSVVLVSSAISIKKLDTVW